MHQTTLPRWPLARFSLIAVLLISGSSLCVFALPMFPEMRSRLAGSDLWISSTTQRIEKVRAGDRVAAKFLVKNLTSDKLTLLGAMTSCYCTIVDDLPFDLAPGQTHVISVSIATSAEAGPRESTYHVDVYFNGTTRGQKLSLTVETVIDAT